MKVNPLSLLPPELQLIGFGSFLYDGSSFQIEALCAIDPKQPNGFDLYTDQPSKTRQFTIQDRPYRISGATGKLTPINDAQAMVILEEEGDEDVESSEAPVRFLPEATLIFLVLQPHVKDITSNLKRPELMAYFRMVHDFMA